MDSDQIIRFLTKIFNQGATGQNFDNAGDSDLRDALVSLVNEVDVGFDSDQVVTIIRENTQSTNPDSEYVERRIIAAQQNTVDSDLLERRIIAAQQNTVDSEYVEGRIIAAQQNTVDSDHVERRIIAAQQDTVDSDWVYARLAELDSDEINTLIAAKIRDIQADSEWVIMTINTLANPQVDSDWVLSTIDSDYVNERVDSELIVGIIVENPVLPDEDSDKIATIEGLLGIGREAGAAIPAVDVDDSDFITYTQTGTVLDNDLVFRFKIMEGTTQLHSTLVRVSEGTRATNLLRILAVVVAQDQIASEFFARFELSGPTNNRIEYAFLAGLGPNLAIEIEITTRSNEAAFTVSR